MAASREARGMARGVKKSAPTSAQKKETSVKKVRNSAIKVNKGIK